MTTYTLTDYQKELSSKHIDTLHKHKILYYVMEQRTYKTITALLTIQKYYNKYKPRDGKNHNKVLFVTGKKIIKDIELDISMLKKILKDKYTLQIDVINYEMLHKINKDNDYTFIVVDEPQTLGAFPKPNLRTRLLKDIVQYKLLILLSGTPTPEGFSQIYHQLYISMNTPFKQWGNFYNWVSAGFVEPTELRITGRTIKIYKNAREDKILPYVKPFMITFTQKQAGFKQKAPMDIIRLVPGKPSIQNLIKILLKDRYYKCRKFEGEIIADTAVALQQKIHQLSSGTIICTHPTETVTVKKKIIDPELRKKVEVEIEEPKKIYKILDESKADFIEEEYKDKKIAIFYKYISEGTVLRKRFNTTEDNHEFNASEDLVFISQFRSGSRGINLSTADLIIAYNIDFSYEIYSQFRQRLSSKDRKEQPIIHWLFTAYGMEDRIYLKVIEKESYTLTYFKEDYMSTKITQSVLREALSIKNAIYKLTVEIQNMNAATDLETLKYCKEQFIKTGLIEEKDFDSPYGKEKK